MGSSEEECLKVVMLPWLGYGHISPFLELAKKLSDRNFRIYICSTPEYLSSIKKRITKNYSHLLHLVELHLPPPTDSSPEVPSQSNSHLYAFQTAKPIFSNLLETLQPDLLIHDILLTSTGSAVASQHNIPAVAFHICSAAVPSYYCHMERHPDVEFPFPAIRLRDYEVSDIMKSVSRELENDRVGTDRLIVLMNSSREMEGKYMDHLSQLKKWEILPIGALVRDPNIGEDDDSDDTELIDWLGRKDEFSTVHVAFGSDLILKREEIEEIAYGLEQSQVNFIWAIRAPMPPGFLERVQERGKIVEKWAPQAKILNHSSIGGFVSHCGWNSVLESIEFGVPMIAMPIHLDQPVNAKVAVEHGVGVEVLRDDKGRLRREEISRVIRDVVVGKRGDVLRRRVGELRGSVRSARGREMEGVVQKLTQLCGKRKGVDLSSTANFTRYA